MRFAKYCLILMLALLPVSSFGIPVFSIKGDPSRDSIIPDAPLSVDITVTNNSKFTTDLSVVSYFQDGAKLPDNTSCQKVPAGTSCPLTQQATPIHTTPQALQVEASGFSGRYSSYISIPLKLAKTKSLYISDREASFTKAWSSISGLASSDNVSLYIAPIDSESRDFERVGRHIYLDKITERGGNKPSTQINEILSKEIKDYDGFINLFIQISTIIDGANDEIKISSEVADKVASITLIPEGTSVFWYNGGLDSGGSDSGGSDSGGSDSGGTPSKGELQRIANFADDAYEKGINGVVNIAMWESVDLDALLDDPDVKLGDLAKHRVGFKTFDFTKDGQKIQSQGLKDLLMMIGLYIGSINETALESDIFVPSGNFNNSLPNMALVGSWSKTGGKSDGVSYWNQIEQLQGMVKDYQGFFNIIFKGHPSEKPSVNDWIAENASSTIGYFNSFPYEYWIALGGGVVEFDYEQKHYNFNFPSIPEKLYSLFSSTLYSVEINTIERILGYSKVDVDSSSDDKIIEGGTLLDAPDKSVEQDYTDYLRLIDHVGKSQAELPFNLVFDWLKGVRDPWKPEMTGK